MNQQGKVQIWCTFNVLHTSYLPIFIVVSSNSDSDEKLTEVIQGYITQIEELKYVHAWNFCLHHSVSVRVSLTCNLRVQQRYIVLGHVTAAIHNYTHTYMHAIMLPPSHICSFHHLYHDYTIKEIKLHGYIFQWQQQLLCLNGPSCISIV